MKTTTALALAAGLSAAILTSASANAAVVCNGAGECWHTHEAFAYPAGAGIVVHPEGWRWEGEKYHWREHEGRGYWHGGNWMAF